MGEVATRDRFRGCLLGLAAGDALGTTLEFIPPGSFEPMDDMVGGGPFGLQPGQWTDDTSMALCLATSLLECNGFDPTDQSKDSGAANHSARRSRGSRVVRSRTAIRQKSGERATSLTHLRRHSGHSTVLTASARALCCP